MEEKKKNKALYIVLSVVLGIVIITGLSLIFSIVVKNIAHNRELETNKEQITKYMENKYNEQFNIELVSEGYKTKRYTIDASNFACGEDKNVKEYVYKVTSNKTAIETYITLYKKIDTNETTIEEGTGSKENNNNVNYENSQKLVNEIKPGLEKLISKCFKTYEVDVDSQKNQCIFKVNENYSDQTEKYINLVGEIIAYIKSKNYYSIKIVFNDYTAVIDSNCNLDDNKYEKGIIEKVKDITSYLKNNFGSKYKVRGGSEKGLVVTIDGNSRTEYNSNSNLYENLYEKLRKLIYTNRSEISIEFNNKTIKVYDTNSIDLKSRI